eukprot:scaffold151963_cov35-Tisochrysis_lutea.AAC.2
MAQIIHLCYTTNPTPLLYRYSRFLHVYACWPAFSNCPDTADCAFAVPDRTPHLGYHFQCAWGRWDSCNIETTWKGKPWHFPIARHSYVILWSICASAARYCSALAFSLPLAEMLRESQAVPICFSEKKGGCAGCLARG